MSDPTATRRAPTWLLVAVIGGLVPWSCVANFWFAGRELYVPLRDASDGLLHPSLQVGLPSVVFWVALMRVGGLRFCDFGWRRADLLYGLLATLLVWVGCHGVALVAQHDDLAPNGELEHVPARAVGRLLGQLLGNALCEETLYRGFCLAQFVVLLRARGLSRPGSAWLAALLSAVCFAVPHVPNRLLYDRYDGFGDVLLDQGRLLCSGLFLAWVYLRSKNLWWAVGLHALANYPSLVVEWPAREATRAAVSVLGLLVTIAWPWIFRRSARGS